MFNNLVNALPHIQEGRMVPIAIGSLTRAGVLPAVPPLADAFPGLTAVNWYAAFGPAGMPAALTDGINAAMARAIQAPAVVERLTSQGITPAPAPAAQFAREVAEEVAEWARVARAANIQPE
jgi:tripartite-type tricarboxylate transporter receptor subunit TctC